MLALLLDLSIKAPGAVEELTGQMTNTSYAGNILIGLLFVVVIAVYGFFLDPHNRLISLLSIYIGLSMVKFFPFERWDIFGWNMWLLELVLFLAAMVSTVLILSLTHLFKIIYVKNFIKRWWEAGISGFLHSGLLVSVILSFLPAKFLTQFSPWFLNIFISEKARFWWVILPIVGLLLMRHKSKAGRPPAY